MTDISQIHLVRHLVHEDVYYPPHAPRKETEEYKAIHHKLTVEEDRPCYICQIRHSQGGEMETHHVWVEWALANAVEKEKLEAFFGHPIEDLETFVDHDEENLMVLCANHHRHRELGIHELTYPIWIAQKFVATPLTKSDS